MSSNSSVTAGWTRRNSLGHILWDTFTTQTQIGEGWYRTYRATCACPTDCGTWLFRYDPYHEKYERSFEFSENTTINVDLHHGTVPTKFEIYVNNVLHTATPFSGLSGYQQQLTSYLNTHGLPNQIVDVTTVRVVPIIVTIGDVIKVIATTILPQDASYKFLVPCGTLAPVDCVLSPWGVWSAWVDNLDDTETRTRTRTVVTAPQNGGAVCGPLTESQTQPIVATDCVLSGWSDWSSWVSDGLGLDTRTRTRIVITPPVSGGAPCGPLTESETRPTPIPVNCVLGAWSAWSNFNGYDSTSGLICQTRTRPILTPAQNGGIPCGPTIETNCVSVDIRDFNYELLASEDGIVLDEFQLSYPDEGMGYYNPSENVGSTPTYVLSESDYRMQRIAFKDNSVSITSNITVTITDVDTNVVLHTFQYTVGDAIDEVFNIPLPIATQYRIFFNI